MYLLGHVIIGTMKKRCARCNAEFKTYSPSQKFCSLRCRSTPLSERFWSKVLMAERSVCWLWQGGTKSDNGRPIFWIRGRQEQANRVAWKLAYGPIEDGLQVQHVCDNGKCVNPYHLYLGTQSQNMRDRFSRHPETATRGEKHGNARLTWDEVRSIRRMYARGNSQQRLAGWFGVSRSTIEGIIIGRTWRE